MQGRKLILADSTEYPEGEAGYADGQLWLYLPPGADLGQVFADFHAPEKTAHIEFVYGEKRDAYNGFTALRGLFLDTDGNLHVHMARPVQTKEG